jgi:hypothetical protein
MRREQIAAGVLALLAGGLVVAAIVMVGGPGQGQREKRNRERADDLWELRSCLSLLTEAELVGLASGPLTDPLPCNERPTLADPYSGEPYRFQALERGRFSLCATFEKPAPNPQRYGDGDFNLDTGCLTFSAAGALTE